MNRRLGPSVRIHAQDFIIWALSRSLEEVGRTMNLICEAMVRKDFTFIRQYPFVTRCFVGYQHRAPIPAAVRRDVLAEGVCRLCPSTDRLTVDHIKAICRGGTDKRANLQCLCFTCNRAKGPQRGGLK